MSRLSRLAMVACILLVSSVVQAQETRQDPRVATAKTACAAGDVQQGVRLLAEIYTATNDPIWIFNQGRCYHQNSQFSQALARFKEFLRKSSNGPAEDIKDAQSYIQEIEAELHKNDAKPEAPSGGVGGATTISQNKPGNAPSPQEGRGLRYTGIGCMVLGGVALASGIAFTLLKQKAESDVENQTKSSTVRYSDVSGKFSDGKLYANLQWVGYGVGTGALLAGGILYYIGATRAAAPASTTAIAPLFVAHGMGASFNQAF
jgi:hypothetical protein